MSTSESTATPSGGGHSTQPDAGAPPTQQQQQHHVTAAPAPDATAADPGDPDEDDLDDLDDMLDDFAAVKVDPSQPAPAPAPAAAKPAATATTAAKAGPTIPTLAGDVPVSELDGFSEDEFQKTLQAGMAELMGGLGDFENDPEIKAHFENMLKELGAGKDTAKSKEASAAAAPSSSSAKPSPGGATPLKGKSPEELAADLSADASFQETIRRTMARMQASGDQATAAAAAEGSEDDFMAEMMKAMKDMPGGGEGSEEELSKMLMGMMNQLTNKEILYDPMRELNDKFPGWLEKNGPTISAEDKKRYEGQRQLVKEMVDKFEEPTYKDENVADREYIVERMQKMQESGSPPPDLVGDMPSAKEVLDMPDDSCATQ